MEIPKCLILAPRYTDDVNHLTVESKAHASRNDLFPDEKDHIDVFGIAGNKSSLLTLCFNELLVEALNHHEKGNITHFAMIHSDVVCDPGWLNVLYSLMRDRKDVAVSAVVNIKEYHRSKTSTAVGSRKDHFDIRRYICVQDRKIMPETFNTADVAQQEDEVLLINTGLWIGDLSWPGWQDFAFDFENKIARNPTTGKRQAVCCPEDWFLSYYLDRMGAPYSASWRVRTNHYGPSFWDNHEIPVGAAN